jgi:hypothetical protein
MSVSWPQTPVYPIQTGKGKGGSVEELVKARAAVEHHAQSKKSHVEPDAETVSLNPKATQPGKHALSQHHVKLLQTLQCYFISNSVLGK